MESAQALDVHVVTLYRTGNALRRDATACLHPLKMTLKAKRVEEYVMA